MNSSDRMNFYQNNDMQDYFRKQETERKLIKQVAVAVAVSMIVLIASSIAIGILVEIFIEIFGINYSYEKPNLETQLVGMVIYVLRMIIPAFVLCKIMEKKVAIKKMFQGGDPKITIISIPIVMMVALVSAVIVGIAVAFFQEIIGVMPQTPEFTVPEGNLAFVFYMINIMILPAFLEEFLFRGIIMQSLRKIGDKTAIIVSSLLFSLVHANLQQSIATFILGIVIAYFVIKTESLWTGILLHFINNSYAVVMGMISDNIADPVILGMVGLAILSIIVISGIISIVIYKSIDKTAFKVYNKPSMFSTPMQVKHCLISVMLIPIAYFFTSILSSFA